MKNVNVIGNSCKIDGKIGYFNSIGDFVKVSESSVVGNCCQIGQNVCIGNNVKVGNNVIIEDDVNIPDGCVIGNSVTIRSGVDMGVNNIIHDRCIVCSHTHIGKNNEFFLGSVIGSFSYEVTDKKLQGELFIGDDNCFGENCYISCGKKTERGSETRIGNKVRIQNNVSIGFNSKIAENEDIPLTEEKFTTVISSGVFLGDSAEVSVSCMLEPHALVRPHCKIGAGTLVRMNSCVSQDVPPFSKIIGNRIVGYHKRPLAENLGFDTYDDDYLKLVGYMIETACQAANAYEAIEKLQNYKGQGQWYDKALGVIVEFLEKNQNFCTLMKFEK